MYSPLYERALRFAILAHAGQKRKGTDLPYVTHLIHVGHILTRHDFADEVVAAGLLHDVIEDTPVEIEELEEAFGARITSWVLDVTEDKTIRDRIERKKDILGKLAGAPEESLAVKSADVLHNLSTTLEDLEREGEAVWERFNVPADRKIVYYEDVLRTLGAGWQHPLLEEADRLLARIRRG